MRKLFFTLLVSTLLTPALSQAQAADLNVPPSLEPWVDWVLDESPLYGCTWVDGDRTCDWPGVLEVRASDSGATFSQKLEVDRKLAIALPGDAEHWPEDVRADGKAIAIENMGDMPFVTLLPGSHTLTGRFVWPKLPDGLHIPADVGRVELWVGGEQIRFARRAEDGKLWLAKSSEVAAGTARDGVELDVFRVLRDGVPPMLDTVILVRASGRARELNLGNVLPQNVVPMNVTAGLPVQIDAQSGDLRIQLRAGSHEVRIQGRANGDVRSFEMVSAPSPWPEFEIWSWQGDESLRQVEVQGVPGIDPARTSMPQAWRALPAFSVGPKQTLKLDVLRRGQSAQPPNQLRLARQMWLDLSGEALTIRDRIHGSMKQDWRLDLEAAPLGHVSLSGEDQLITQSPVQGSHASGVEIRDGNVDLTAEWRLDRKTSLPAVGWSQDMQHLSAVLHIPPGWSLLAARGVDKVPNTWVARWNVYGFFFVLLIALAIGKLAGWRWLPVALVGFVLAYHESDMPLVVWVVLLALLALLTVLPAGVWRTLTEATWACTALALIFQLAPFLVTQVREAMYPQIEQRYVDYSSFGFGGTAKDFEAPASPAPTEEVEMMEEPLVQSATRGRGDMATIDAKEQMAAEDDLAIEQKPAGGSIFDKRKRRILDSLVSDPAQNQDGDWNGYSDSINYRSQQKSLLKQDPNAVISTGPGVYNWEWKRADLSWSGPVAKDHQIQLWLLSPLDNRFLTAIRVLCLLALAIVLLLLHPWRPRPASASKHPPASKPAPSTTAAAAASLLILTSVAQAQSPFPSSELLDELRERVTKSPECDDACVELGTATVRVKGNAATLDLDVHAATDSAVTLPGPAKSWTPDDVRIDGRSSTALRLDGSGFLQLKVPAGKHTVQLSGLLPPEDAVTLEFSEQPHRVEVSAPEWEAIGLREDGRISGSLQLQRRMDVAGEQGKTSASKLPPWFMLTRRLEIGVRWSVTSTLERRTPIGSPEIVRIPLLPGESVTESELEIENGELVISFGRDEQVRTWTSSLSPTKSLTLTAAQGRPWSEAWQITCGPIWRCTAGDNLAPVSHLSGAQWSPVYRPWPGEKLTVTFVQPKGVKGATSTIDNATLTLRPGNRLLSATLQASIRTSQGGPHKWQIPSDAAVQSLAVNGEDIPIEFRKGKLQTTLRPGENSVAIEWQQDRGMGTTFNAPKVSLGAQAVNLRTEIELPQDRWLIWANGPSWGPAILFWSNFFLILLLALLASRVPRSPLRLHEWVLLGLGLTQVPTWVALLLAGWFFALAYRRARPFTSAGAFNVTQLALAFYTLIALVCFYAAVHTGLLVNPDWQVEGQGSHNGQLNWYLDRSEGAMPHVSVLSLPLGWWRGVMLVWALWLAWKLLGWVPWAWTSFSEGGRWKKFPKKPKAPQPGRARPAGATPASASVPAGVTTGLPSARAGVSKRKRKDTPRASLPPEGLGFKLPKDNDD